MFDSDRLEDWLAYIQTIHFRSMDLTLERSRQVAGRLHLRPFRHVISVAGTNGKGSSVAYLEAIYRQAGYRTGAYTSPHLVNYNERVRLDGRPVDDQTLLAAFRRVESARGQVPLTYFEFGTLVALCIFADADPDLCILEVGMGGRLDTVNIVDADVALITEIGLDHQQWLGHDVEAIGREKAGIMRAGKPVVSSGVRPPASLALMATQTGATLVQLGRQFGFEQRADGWDWLPLDSTFACDSAVETLPLPAASRIQVQNAAGAIAAVQLASAKLPVDPGQIRSGLGSVVLPGRCQLFEGQPRRLFDVSHNADGLTVLADYLARLEPGGRVIAVFSMLADKNADAALARIAGLVDEWYVAPVDNERSASAPELETAIRQHSSADVTQCGNIVEAMDRAGGMAHGEDLVVAFGSFYAVGDIMRHLDLEPYPLR